jgi:primosomal protein N' (replication factor Y)
MISLYADIIIPVAVTGSYTYAIPPHLREEVSRGSLVTVPFGQRKSHTGLVIKLHGEAPSGFTPKEITSLMAPPNAIGDRLTDFVLWISDYYMAQQGEVMKAAIPTAENLRVRRASKKKAIKGGSEATAAVPPYDLTTTQREAYEKINSLFGDHEVVLLHGVTSSGKTEIYIHLISEQLRKGKQVLYLLPEIALTSQIIERLQRHLGDTIGVYHSRLTNASRRDVWTRVNNGSLGVVLGVRSSLFLPFRDLGLIIVDEEHDPSYKQVDPAPRYQARDAAMMLSRLHGGVTLLGSATPSVESYHNAMTGRYGLVELITRYGDVMMPEMLVADTRNHGKRKGSPAYFTPRLLEAISDALSREEQVILFQNRRGFSPYIMCSDCGWVQRCTGCSVSTTYHKGIGRMVCHYCGRSEPLPRECPECGSVVLSARGFGTEKIEEEIKILFPTARVARMDQDTTRLKHSSSEILSDFAAGATDILIGTQMISKGLDFERLTVVGILDADSMLYFPDFRAFERSFQLMEQVSGRSGRRAKRGRVIIQTADPSHSILRQVLKHDYKAMYRIQLEERELFGYPPFTRIIKITLKHRDLQELNDSSARLADRMRKRLGKYVLGPEFPLIMQVQKWYIKTIMIKLGKELSASRIKELIRKAMDDELKMQRTGVLRIHADVDPQ